MAGLSAPTTDAVRPVPWGPLLVGLGAGLLGWAGVLLLGWVTPAAVAAGLVVVLVGLALVARHRRSGRLGWANAVTLARLVGLGWVVSAAVMLIGGASVGSVAPVVLIVVVGTVSVVLDGVDGHLARARGESSGFGARFDMETDAALIMALCLAVGGQGSVGWWVLVIGLARYAYWLCSWVIPALRRSIAPSVLRKAVAVVQSVALMLALVLAAAGLGPDWLPSAVVGAALAGLVWSFASTTVLQLRATHP